MAARCRLRGRDSGRAGCYGAGMEWPEVQKRIRKIWPKIKKYVPARKATRGPGPINADISIFETLLYLLWHRAPMRKRLGKKYPSVGCLCRRVGSWVESRALDKLWGGYLARLRKDELQAWQDKFTLIRDGNKADGGVNLGVGWCLVMWRVLEDTCRSRGAGGSKKASGTKEWAGSNVNIQKGCEHGCLYCYAHGQAGRYKRPWAKSWTTAQPNPVAIDKGYNKREKPVMFPSTHDITEANLSDCLVVLKKLLAAGNQVLIVSKPHLNCVKVLCRELETYKDQILFRFTIGAADDAVLSFWEPHAPPYRERIDSLRWAFEQGFKTSVSCEPMLDGDIQRVIDDARPFVTDAIWLGRVRMLGNHLALNAPGNTGAKDKARALMDLQTDDWIKALYAKHKDDPMIKYKDSIKKVVGLERPEEAGLDV